LKAAPVVEADLLDEAVPLVGVPVPLGLEVVVEGRVVGAVVPVAVVLGAETLPVPESEVPEAPPLETPAQACCWSAVAAANWSGQFVWIHVPAAVWNAALVQTHVKSV